MNLYKYEKLTGIWHLERAWEGDPPPEWLATAQAAQPEEAFAMAKYAPRGAPKVPKH
ncbi:MAG: hypothetical protein RL701_3041 [Pseudomonadota bacterium]|jgi:hypothetical protein